jgi:hypothetical protein
MTTITNINMMAKTIIDKQNRYSEYENELIRKAEHSYLLKIDSEDKRTFKENKEEIENDKKELELMIFKLLTNDIPL